MKSVVFGLIMFLSLSTQAADFTIEMNGKKPGEVFTFSGTACPTKSLLANGASVAKVGQYADLYAAIGNAHGESGSNFNIPDYRGRFLRMVDGGIGRDPDRSSRTAMNTGGKTGDNVGSVQNHEFFSHTHVQNPHNHGTYTFAGAGGADGAYMGGISAISYTMNIAATATNQNAGGSETRPVNANVIFCVAY